SVGRIPTKGPKGLEWKPLLAPEPVNESVIARATAKNPDGAKKLQERSDIRDMHATIAAHAVAEIKEVMSRSAPEMTPVMAGLTALQPSFLPSGRWLMRLTRNDSPSVSSVWQTRCKPRRRSRHDCGVSWASRPKTRCVSKRH